MNVTQLLQLILDKQKILTLFLMQTPLEILNKTAVVMRFNRISHNQMITGNYIRKIKENQNKIYTH